MHFIPASARRHKTILTDEWQYRFYKMAISRVCELEEHITFFKLIFVTVKNLINLLLKLEYPSVGISILSKPIMFLRLHYRQLLFLRCYWSYITSHIYQDIRWGDITLAGSQIDFYWSLLVSWVSGSKSHKRCEIYIVTSSLSYSNHL